MKRIGCLMLFCLAWASMLTAQVTITATNLKVDDAWSEPPFYLVRFEASDDHAAIRFQILWESSDYTGTYPIGSNNSALVLPAGEPAANASQAVSGNIIIAKPDGAFHVTGSVKCANGVTYYLDLKYVKPVATRQETLTITDAVLEDRTISEETWQLYGFADNNNRYVLITAFSNQVTGHYTPENLDTYYTWTSLKHDGQTEYFDLVDADLQVVKEGDRYVVTGTMLCQSETDPNDVPEYILYISCRHDKKDDPLPNDATDADFEAYFPTYTLNTDEQALNGDIFVMAQNDEGAYVALDVYIADGETEITAGTYPVTSDYRYMSVHASEGVISGFMTPSYAGFLTAGGQLSSPVWYILAGTVLINDQGRIEVNAINSAERKIHCVLGGETQGIEMTNDQLPMTNQIYNLLGQPVSADYHGIVIRDGKKHLQ